MNESEPDAPGENPMSGRNVYFSEIGSRLSDARWSRRRNFIPWPDPDLSGYSPESQLMIRKIVAYWEGGPDPESPEATGELSDIPMPEPFRLHGPPDDEL